MAANTTESIFLRLRHYSVGLIHRTDGSPARDVLGSAVLAAIDGRHGILTCAHVADRVERAQDVGLLFMDDQKQHALVFKDALVTIVGDSPYESEEDLDLAFAMLPPDLVASLEASKGIFLNLERNRQKMDSFASSRDKCVDAVLGMVQAFTEAPTVDGHEITSNLHGAYYSGAIQDSENGLVIFDPKGCPPDKLPHTFGGMSGSGLWRAYLDENDNVADSMLIGIASQERSEEKTIVCQGWGRVEGALIPRVRALYP